MTTTTSRDRDIAYQLHPFTNLGRHETEGPLVITRGKGVYVFDESGREYLEGMAGLWCTALGFGEARLAEAAARQLHTLPYYHQFGGKANDVAITLCKSAGPAFWSARRSSSTTPARRPTRPPSSSSGTTTTRAAGIARRRSSPASAATTAPRWSPPASPGWPPPTGTSTCRSRRCVTPTARTFTATRSRARRKSSSPPAWPRTWTPRSSARTRTPSPPSSPSRSWAPAASSCRRPPTSRRSRRC